MVIIVIIIILNIKPRARFRFPDMYINTGDFGAGISISFCTEKDGYITYTANSKLQPITIDS